MLEITVCSARSIENKIPIFVSVIVKESFGLKNKIEWEKSSYPLKKTWKPWSETLMFLKNIALKILIGLLYKMRKRSHARINGVPQLSKQKLENVRWYSVIIIKPENNFDFNQKVSTCLLRVYISQIYVCTRSRLK